MTDKIKLLYHWIGPNGPIWNTELPNILNFSHVAINSSTSSDKFWSDDLHRFFKCHMLDSNYQVYPTFNIAHSDPTTFLLPFTLTWRVPFNTYFMGNEGILEFSHTPPHIIDLVRNKNGYILINHSIEAFMNPKYIDALHSYFNTVHNIPLHKIIYMTGCINAVDLYEQYCIERNIGDNRLSIVSHATSFTSFKQNTVHANHEPFYNTKIVPNKLFLMWNRRIRGHRVEMAVNLERHNLVDRSLISFSDVDVDMPGNSVEHRFDKDRLEHIFNIDPIYISKFLSRLPLILDGEEDNMQMCQDYNNKSRPFYTQSLVSIVTETNYYDREVSLTEKSFKPAKEKHPFIIVGVNGALKGMHELGFKTFNDFWDESYDDIAEPGERMRKLMDVVSYIGSWTDEQILEFRRNVKPILDHNYNVIRNASNIHAVNTITDIIRKN